MNPELRERLVRHGRWLDEASDPLPFDALAGDHGDNADVAVPVVDLVPSTTQSAAPRRATWAVAAVVAAAVLVAVALVVRAPSDRGGTAPGTTDTPPTTRASSPTAVTVATSLTTAVLPTAGTTTSEPTITIEPTPLDDTGLRAALAGLWMRADESVDDTTGPLPGPDWFGVSFVPGDGSPFVVVTPCVTFVGRNYRIVDGRLVIDAPLSAPATSCPSTVRRERTEQLRALLASGPVVAIDGDQVSIGAELTFAKQDAGGFEPGLRALTIEELRGRSFIGLSVGPSETGSAMLTFGPGLVVRTPCSVFEADAAIVDGRLRATVTKRTVSRVCDDSDALTVLTAWPQVMLREAVLPANPATSRSTGQRDWAVAALVVQWAGFQSELSEVRPNS